LAVPVRSNFFLGDSSDMYDNSRGDGDTLTGGIIRTTAVR
jgi:hypothetical protein